MSDALYAKILAELEEIKFSGTIQWFYVNEPLLDKKWKKRLTALRKACPRATIHVTTNWDTEFKKNVAEQFGTILDLFEAGVNSLNINDYSDRGYQNLVDSVINVHGARKGIETGDHAWKQLGPRKKHLSVGGIPKKIHSWGGSNDSTMGGKGHCARPARHIVVTWDGQVPICCAANPVTAESLGDVNKSSMMSIWNSRRFFEYRLALQDGVRKWDCAMCDAKVAYAWVFRKVSIPKRGGR
jgi:MoaA/NifB/PqqE/SkfB family radical SAM enzyme